MAVFADITRDAVEHICRGHLLWRHSSDVTAICHYWSNAGRVNMFTAVPITIHGWFVIAFLCRNSVYCVIIIRSYYLSCVWV